MLGTIVNSLAIVVGGFLGLVVRGGLGEKSKETVLHGLGLAIILIGFSKAIETNNPLVVIGSLVLGGLTGEWLDIEGRLYSLASKAEKAFIRGESKLGQAFVNTSLIYCVGAMAITGSIESGLTGNHATLFAKAMLDGISAIVFASTMGVGVVFSAVSVFLYQGGITMLAGTVANWLTQAAIVEMSAAGGLLIVAIGINILELKRIRLGNLLPAMFYAAILAQIF